MGMMWVIWVPLVLFCAFFLYRILANSNKRKTSKTEPLLDILNRRYAKGELSTEEYEKIKKVLEDNQ
jgi:uncharacterized membrane protein